MNKKLENVLLIRPLALLVGGGASALVNPALQSGSLLPWIIVIFAGTAAVVWLAGMAVRLRPAAEILSPTIAMLGWGVLATVTGGLKSPFIVAFVLEILLAVVSTRPRGVAWVTLNALVVMTIVEVFYGFAELWLLAVEAILVIAIGVIGATMSRRRVAGEAALRTQGEQLGQRLDDLQRELEDERVISRVGENVARLAHGLKNAVHSLRGFVSLIEPQLERGAGTNAALAGLHAAIDDLEKLARLTLAEGEESPRNAPRAAEATAAPAAQRGGLASVPDAVAAARSEVESASPGVRWTVTEGAGGASLQFPIESESLLELLVILLRNGVEAMGGEGAGGVEYFADRDHGSIVVWDEGPGFAPEVLENVFQPGYTTKPKGSGFGLFLARRIVEDHGGRLELEARKAGGAQVRVDLPRADAMNASAGRGA